MHCFEIEYKTQLNKSCISFVKTTGPSKLSNPLQFRSSPTLGYNTEYFENRKLVFKTKTFRGFIYSMGRRASKTLDPLWNHWFLPDLRAN